MSPRESNEVRGAVTGSVTVAVVDIGRLAFSSKQPPPDMRLRRERRDQAGSSVLSACCPCEPVQTATPPTGPWRAPQKFAEAGQNLLLRKVTDGTIKVKECGRAVPERKDDPRDDRRLLAALALLTFA